MPKKVVLECNPDEVLMMALGVSRKEIEHQPDKGRVCIFQSEYNTRFAMIDEDPGAPQPTYLKQLVFQEEKHGIKRMTRPDSNCTVLIIKPRLEEWTIAQCKYSAIDPAIFYLPDNAKDLKKVINLKLDRFRSLVIKLKEENNPGIIYLRQLLETA